MNGNHQKMLNDFKKRFKISLIITVPILVLSPMIQGFLNYSLDFPGSKYSLFLLSLVIFFYGGWPFLSGLKDELSEKKPVKTVIYHRLLTWLKNHRLLNICYTIFQ